MRLLLAVITLVFTAFSLAIVAHTGVWGFYEALFASPVSWQLLADLTLALTGVMAWMHQDARRHGRAFWPWVPVTLLLGSIGPLLYLLRRTPSGASSGAASGRSNAA